MVDFFRSINSLVWLSSTLYTDDSFIHNSASGCTKHRTVNHDWLRAVNLLLTFGESGLHFMAFDRFRFDVLWWQWFPWERKLGLAFCNKHKHDRPQFIRILDLRDSTHPENQPLEILNSENYLQYSTVYSL